jgi:signal transduction histidine kinase
MLKTELKIINSLMACAHRAAPPEHVLPGMLRQLTTISPAERAVLYVRDSAGAWNLVAEATPTDAAPSPPCFVTGSPFAVAAESLRQPWRNDQSPPDFPGHGYPHTLAIPFDFGSSRGVLLLLGVSARLDRMTINFANLLGETLAIVLEDLAATFDQRRSFDEMDLFHRIGRDTYTTLEPTELAPLLASELVATLDARTAWVILLPSPQAGIDSRAVFRHGSQEDPEESERAMRYFDQAAAERRTLIDQAITPGPGGTPRFMTAMPLLSRGSVIGGAVLAAPTAMLQPSLFSEIRPRMAFLESLQGELAMALATSLQYAASVLLADGYQKRLRELSLLHELGRNISGTFKLDEILRMMLTAVTFGHGFGFNRAALFLINEKSGILQGMMAVGPRNAEEAYRIWSDLSGRDLSLQDVLRKSIDPDAQAPLDATVKGIRIPIEPGGGILARTVIEKRAFNVRDESLQNQVNPQIADKLGTRIFATVPIMAEDAVLGVLAVDNLFNRVPIEDDDLRLLGTFAAQAAMAIRNARLYTSLQRTNQELKLTYRRLARHERLAILGEMSATIAHELRNPLMAIGGFVRRMDRYMPPDDPNRRYPGIILKEVVRLEKYLSEVLDFSRDGAPTFQEVDLNRAIGEIVELIGDDIAGRGIRLDLALDPALPLVRADRDQISHAFMNLLNNSLAALADGGAIGVETRREDDRHVLVTFSDNGGGILPELVPSVFTPFFTTKKSGTGLGLPMVQKYVRNHNGSIEITNDYGTSIAFKIRLPIDPEQEPNEEEPEEGQP